MPGKHDPFLVALSLLIAIAASYTALDLAGRVAVSAGRARLQWLLSGAFAMGVGIWSMHFVAMLAFSLPVPIGYDIPRVMLSALVAFAASLVALSFAARPLLGITSLLGGAMLMGTAIAGMHYLGMSSLRASVITAYDPLLVVASIAVAISAAAAALWLAHHYRLAATRGAEVGKIVSAIVMGAAIVGMHFTAMAAVRFTVTNSLGLPAGHLLLTGSTLTASVALGTLLVLAMALVAAAVDRRVHLRVLDATRESASLLRAQQAFLRQVIDANPNLIFAKDQGGRYTLVNRAMAEVYGTTPAELVGKSDADFNLDPDEVARYLAADREVITTGGARRIFQEQLTSPVDGLVRWFESVKVPLDPGDGSALQVLGVSAEITDRKQLADQLRQAQKMEAIGQLTGGIAHDLNNILTVILANSDLLAEGLPVEQDELRQDVLDLQGAAGRGAEMVRKLLAFSRREMVNLRPLALGRLCEEWKSTLSRLLPATIRVVVETEAELPGVLGDAGAIEQIILNLATNARDAMPQGGLLVIRTTSSLLDEEWCATQGWGEPGRYVCVSVGDTGEGIDAANLARVFDPFFTTKPQGVGTGLGLSMVYGLMRQHEGYVNIYSEARQGTTVRLYFPAIVQPEEGSAAVAEVPLRGGTETILVADDEESIRRSATRVLERFGYQVFTAADGEEALERIAELGDALDLVISDVVMPQMGGRELYRALRRDQIDVAFMYTSGYAAREVHESIELEPDVPFLHKPWAMSDLLTKVREVLDGR
ncbi:MAG: MHYT domain-containing protein [Gemmatimonadales bacterium]